MIVASAAISALAFPVAVTIADPNAPGCGIAQINMTQEAKKALKVAQEFGYLQPLLGTTPARVMGLAALTSAAAGTVLGLLALRDRDTSANPMSPRAEEGQALTTIADASFLAAAAFVPAGVVLYDPEASRCGQIWLERSTRGGDPGGHDSLSP